MIFLDTNVISETLKPVPDPLVIEWLTRHDAELALPCISIAELAYGIARIQLEQRAQRLERGLDEWIRRFAGRIFAFNERSALVYGTLMATSALHGRPMSLPDGIIAAITITHNGSLATRNIRDYQSAGIDLINPWSPNTVQEHP